MQMNSKDLSLIKSKLKKYLKDKEILDIIVFGSFVKGKAEPRDIDIAVVSDKKESIDIKGFHVSNLKPSDFFVRVPSLVHTLLREGYSLKNNKFLSEVYKFSNRVLFSYSLTSLKPTDKVKIVNVLRGRTGEKGLVLENGGGWLANQVFLAPIGTDNIFEKFFLNFKVKFNKSYILIH